MLDRAVASSLTDLFMKIDIDTIDSGLQMYIVVGPENSFCSLLLFTVSFQVVVETAIDALISVCTVVWGAPLFALPLAIIGGLQYWISLGYVSVSRDLRRIESNTRSPIISSFSELVKFSIWPEDHGSLSHSVPGQWNFYRPCVRSGTFLRELVVQASRSHAGGGLLLCVSDSIK